MAAQRRSEDVGHGRWRSGPRRRNSSQGRKLKLVVASREESEKRKRRTRQQHARLQKMDRSELSRALVRHTRRYVVTIVIYQRILHLKLRKYVNFIRLIEH